MLSTCGSTAAEEYIPFSDLWREICGKKSRAPKQCLNINNITPHIPVSKNPWTCLKNHGLCQVPISFSFPGSQQSTRLPVITTAWSGIAINVKVKVQTIIFVLIWDCEIAVNVKLQKTISVLIWDCEIAIIVKVKVQKLFLDWYGIAKKCKRAKKTFYLE